MNLEGKERGTGKVSGDNLHTKITLKLDAECEKRTIAFIRKNAETDKPFFVYYSPQTLSFLANPQKIYFSNRSIDSEKLL